MDRPPSEQARLARYDPYAYQGNRQGYPDEREAQTYPLERRPQGYPDYDRPPQYPMSYRQPMESRDKVQLAAIGICAFFILLIFASIMFVWAATPTPIVTHSNPSCVVWCD